MAPPSTPVPSARIDALDILRGIALFGVLTVNLVSAFRVSIFSQFLPPDAALGYADALVAAGVRDFLELKAFALFSLLFGVGLAVQYEQLLKSARPAYWLTRRMAVLLGFGLLHLLLLWNGDILVEYALAGLLVIPLLRAPNRFVAMASGLMIAIYLLVSIVGSPVAWPSANWMRQHVPIANQVYASGNYVQILKFGIGELPYLIPLHVAIFPRTLALFLFGIWIWRSGALRNPERFAGVFRATAAACFLGGLMLANSDMAALIHQSDLRPAVQNTATVLLAVGFGGGVILLAQTNVMRPVMAAFAPVGRMAFTNYITQSLVFAFVFFGYGLGQFARHGAASAFFFGMAFFAVQCAYSSWWLRHFRYGPIEWLWRVLMHGRRQPMTLQATT